MKELAFYVANAEEINRKYSGKHIAIVGNKVVASGNDPKKVWEEAKKKHPNKKPVLAFVPKEETFHRVTLWMKNHVCTIGFHPVFQICQS